ncbi:hypothetical protein EI969_23600 [Pseudomonas sp. PB101]|nr:hypothetical protein [Pseudomonas sp. PB101]
MSGGWGWCFDCTDTTPSSVGASLLAKVVNDDTGNLDKRGVPEFFASGLAPTGDLRWVQRLSTISCHAMPPWSDAEGLM